MYHSFCPLLDEDGISNFKGFIPINYLIPIEKFMKFHKDSPSANALYES